MKKIACALFGLFLTQGAFADDDFSYTITHTLLKDHSPAENLFVSPYSMKMSLQMALDGAQGHTLEEMKRVLGPKPPVRTSANFGSLQALALDSSFTPQISYLELIKNQFQADLLSVNFAHKQDEAVAIINKWAATNTKGMIQNLIQPQDVDAMTRLVLLNATIFKGDWQIPFAKESTHKAPFKTSDGNEVMCDMMQHSGYYRYTEDESVATIVLPFKREPNSPEYICRVILPKNEKAGETLKETLSSSTLFKYRRAEKQEYVEFSMPKVTLEQRTDLKPALQAIGITDAFTSKANFSGISLHRDLYIDKVFQQAALKMDEHGLEAAAATAVTMGLLSTAPSDHKHIMRCDHSFFLLITEKEGTEPLFIGYIAAP